MTATKMSRLATLVGLGLILGCSSTGSGSASGVGGTTAGSGGTNGSGGQQGTGGVSGTGGVQGAGGTTGSGGRANTGGAIGSGGAATGSGGAAASGGATTGGGGATVLGGATTGSGGATTSGGAKASSGGATASGGATTGSGGRTGSGGATSASGGTQGAGGLGTGGRTGSGGATGTGGGTTGSGGAQGTGGTQGIATRPSYNTGTGFFVLNGKLYDANGVEFRIRGVNRNHYDMEAPGIAKTHANTARPVLFFNGEWGSSASRNVEVMQQDMINNHIVPMPGNWEGTCDESPATLTTIVDRWVAQASSYTPLDKYMILNIANEWGPSSTVWRDSYITAVQRLRAAGYTCTISVTSGGCGQDNADLAKYAQAVFDADPQKNVIFDQHIYGNWGYDAQKQSWQQGLVAGLDALVATGLPVIIGEFGPGQDIGPSPTNITPKDIIQAAEARGLGWMAWAWDDNPSAGDTWFALSRNGDYNSSADLTTFGKSVVEGTGYGLLALAKPATMF